MFNSKKIKKLTQQQELLDAKINSLAHGQKTLSEDFEVHFKRLRQCIYTSVEEFSSELQDKLRELNKELEAIKKQIVKFQDPSRLLKEESETIKKQNGIINENIARMRNSLQIDFDLVKDQIVELKNQVTKPIEIPKTQEITQPLGVAEAPKVPTWTMRSGTAEYQSSPIQDKMNFTLEETIEPKEDFSSKEIRKRQPRKDVNSRTSFFINAKLPEGVFNYLHNRSSNKSVSTTCRNVFEREGKLVFAPLSYEITKNFSSSNFKIITIQVSKTTYLAMRKIGKELKMPTTNVATNFIASLDTAQSMEVAMTYSRMNSKELQFKTTQKK